MSDETFAKFKASETAFFYHGTSTQIDKPGSLITGERFDIFTRKGVKTFVVVRKEYKAGKDKGTYIYAAPVEEPLFDVLYTPSPQHSHRVKARYGVLAICHNAEQGHPIEYLLDYLGKKIWVPIVDCRPLTVAV